MNASEIAKLDINAIIKFSLALQTNVEQFYHQTFTQIVASPRLEAILNGSIPHHNGHELKSLYLIAFGNTTKVSDLPKIVKGLDHPDNTPSAKIVIYILTAITTFVVALRMYSRHKYCGGIRGNDIMLLGALMVQYIAESVELTAAYKFGAGKHTYDVTYAQYKWNLVLCYVCQLLYFPNLLLVKMSLLLFYMELSPHWLFRRIVLSTVAVFTLIAVAFEFAVAFQCKPFDYWNYPAEDLKCIDRLALFQSMGIINIISDFVVFFMPVAVVVRLKLRLREKVIVISIFGLGAFACITSIFRLFSLVDFARSFDVNWTECEIAIWSLFEVHLAIICASVPSLKSLFMHYAPRLIGYGTVRTAPTYGSKKETTSNPRTIGSTAFTNSRTKNGGGLYTADDDTYAEDLEMNINEYRNGMMREDILSAGESEKRISSISKASSKDGGRNDSIVDSTVSLESERSLGELTPSRGPGNADKEKHGRDEINRDSAGMDASDLGIQMVSPPLEAHAR